MRFETLAVVMAGTLAACAPKKGPETCTPVSSWASPVARCVANKAPPPPPPAPEPVKEAEPAPAPEPAKTELSDTQIKLKEKIEFETDSAKIVDSSKPVLDEVAATMKAHPELEKVRVAGHTDSTSTKDHNQKLSDERAAAVKQYLVDHGVEADRLFSKGFGQTRPIADNKTDEGRAQNRRVEIHIMRKHGEKERTDADTMKKE